MASYNGKDIDRVRRATGLGRGEAGALLRQYDGRPDRVLEERCGALRVYAEPERVCEPASGWQTAWQGVVGFFGGLRSQLARAGQWLIGAPALAVILLALVTAPAALVMGLAALFMRLPL